MTKLFKTLDQLKPEGKVILLRADLNVPMKDGKVTDITRITRLLPTLKELSDKGAKIVILSHFGRPKGQKKTELSLEPIAQALAKASGKDIAFANDCIGSTAETIISKMKNGEITVLENTRFYPEEEQNDLEFSKKIAALGDVYVNDAFSTAHRAHATTHRLATLLPTYAGRLMEAELDALNKALENPKSPVVALVGGAKISTKLDLLNNLVTKIDTLVLGGGMANTFLNAIGTSVGNSLCEHDMKDQALKIIETAKKHNCKIILPVDGVVANEFKAGAKSETFAVDNLPSEGMMLDIGSGSIAIIEDELKKAKTLLWNGPLGAFEIEPFDNGTNTLAKIAAALTKNNDLISIAGGGDTVAALVHAGVEDKMTYVSTAGGAFLEWLEGKELPGIKVLSDQDHNKKPPSCKKTI